MSKIVFWLQYFQQQLSYERRTYKTQNTNSAIPQAVYSREIYTALKFRGTNRAKTYIFTVPAVC